MFPGEGGVEVSCEGGLLFVVGFLAVEEEGLDGAFEGAVVEEVSEEGGCEERECFEGEFAGGFFEAGGGSGEAFHACVEEAGEEGFELSEEDAFVGEVGVAGAVGGVEGDLPTTRSVVGGSLEVWRVGGLFGLVGRRPTPLRLGTFGAQGRGAGGGVGEGAIVSGKSFKG